jgi:hypothetical protein
MWSHKDAGVVGHDAVHAEKISAEDMMMKKCFPDLF